MKFRLHRGSLSASLDTIVEVANVQQLADHLNQVTGIGLTIKPEQIEMKPYGFDERTGWQTFLVSVRGFGPVGFSDFYLGFSDGR